MGSELHVKFNSWNIYIDMFHLKSSAFLWLLLRLLQPQSPAPCFFISTVHKWAETLRPSHSYPLHCDPSNMQLHLHLAFGSIAKKLPYWSSGLIHSIHQYCLMGRNETLCVKWIISQNVHAQRAGLSGGAPSSSALWADSSKVCEPRSLTGRGVSTAGLLMCSHTRH